MRTNYTYIREIIRAVWFLSAFKIIEYRKRYMHTREPKEYIVKREGSLRSKTRIKYTKMRQRRTKPTKWHIGPAKTQISGQSAQSDQSSLSAWRKFGYLATHWVHSEDSDKTRRMPRLFWVFAGSTSYFVSFVMRWLKFVIHFYCVCSWIGM